MLMLMEENRSIFLDRNIAGGAAKADARSADGPAISAARHDFAIFSRVDDYLTEEIQCMGGVRRGEYLGLRL